MKQTELEWQVEQNQELNLITLLRVIPTMTFIDLLLANLLAFYLTYLLAFDLASIWHIFWHSTWHSFWHMFWHIFWHMFWHIFWHIFWHSIWPLRSSGADWARKVPGWGPAVPTQIGSQQLRSSSAHCARKLAKRLATSWQGGSGRGSWCRHGRGETGGGGRGGGGGGGGWGEQLW